VWNEKCLDVRLPARRGRGRAQLHAARPRAQGGVWYLVAQVGDQAAPYRVPKSSTRSVRGGRSNAEGFRPDAFWVTSSRAFETIVYHSNATRRVTAPPFCQARRARLAGRRAAAETGDAADATAAQRHIPIESIHRPRSV